MHAFCFHGDKTLVVDAVTFGIHYLLHTFVHTSAQTFDVVVLVDILADSTEPLTVLSWCFCPRHSWLRDFLTVPHPSSHCLVKQKVLKVTRAPGP